MFFFYFIPFSDSGVAMISVAEYLVLQKDFPRNSFDVGSHRSRISFSFYAYGMAKQIYAYESDPEYFHARDEASVPKKKKTGRVEGRKRKVANDLPKTKKERKK